MIDMGRLVSLIEEAARVGTARLRRQALLLPALIRPARSPRSPASSYRRDGRLLLRQAALPALLQPHRPAFSRPGRHLQDDAHWLPLRDHLREAPRPGGEHALGVSLV